MTLGQHHRSHCQRRSAVAPRWRQMMVQRKIKIAYQRRKRKPVFAPLLRVAKSFVALICGATCFRPHIDISWSRKPALLLTLGLLVTAICAGVLSADDAAHFDRYLQRLGLADLRLVHQQQQLATTRDEAVKAERA